MDECREFTITIVSAHNLPSIRKFGEMKVYASVSIKGGHQNSLQTTPTDEQEKTNPKWDFPIKYSVIEASLSQSELQITLHCQRTFGSDKYIGQVNIPVKSLFDMGMDSACTIPVVGTPEGRLLILYAFGERILVDSNKQPPPTSSSSSSSTVWKKKVKKTAKQALIEGTKIIVNELLHNLIDSEDDDK